MAQATLFDRFDQAALHEATRRFGVPLAVAAAPAGRALAMDDAVSPQLMLAAMVRAHAHGLASAAAQARILMPDAASARQLQEQLVVAAIAEIRADLARSDAENFPGSAVQ